MVANEQHPPIETIYNFRSVAGTGGLIWRSSNPWLCDEQDAHVIVNELGIRTVIDVRDDERRDDELEGPLASFFTREHGTWRTPHFKTDLPAQQQPHPQLPTPMPGRAVRRMWFPAPLVDNWEKTFLWGVFMLSDVFVKFWILFYLLTCRVKTMKSYVATLVEQGGLLLANLVFLEYCQPHLVAALEACVHPDHQPVLLHCAYGKDRTGLIAALIQAGCCEVSEETILAQYQASESLLPPNIFDRGMTSLRKMGIRDVAQFGRSPIAVMRGTLEHINRKYGSVRNYLNSIGFGSSKQRTLRRMFRESERQMLLRQHARA